MRDSSPSSSPPLCCESKRNHVSGRAFVTEVRPRLHELRPFFEQVAAEVGRLHLVRDGVGERSLNHFSAEGGALGSPISEGGTEAVNHYTVTKAHTPKNHQARHVRQGLAVDRTGEDVIAFPNRVHLAKN